MARFRDELIDAGGLDALLREHQERYAEINDEAKALPTNERDFRSALRIESKRASFRGKSFGIRAAM